MIPLTPYLPQLLQGLAITLALVSCALVAGIVLALGMTLAIISQHGYLRMPAQVIVFFIRGTPLLVQIFLIYYGSGQFEWLKASWLWPLFREPFTCAIMALAINTAAYTTVLLKGALEAVPENEVMAAKAVGMSDALLMRRITLPRAFRLMLPAYSNEVIIVLKGTSLASTITLLDLMGVVNQIMAQTYASIEFLTVAGVIYLMLNVCIMTVFKIIERTVRIH